MSGLLPEDSASRKAIPLHAGVLAYFPAALVEVAKRSKLGNDTHSPGQPLRWVRDKSNDHLDCLTRHLLEGDLAGVAWRALAALQLECEAKGAPIAPGAVVYSVGTFEWSAPRNWAMELTRAYQFHKALDPVAAEWQDSHGVPANPIKQTDEE